MPEYMSKEGLEYLIKQIQEKAKQEMDNIKSENNYIETPIKLCPYRKKYHAKDIGNQLEQLQRATYIEEEFQYCLGEKCMKYNTTTRKCDG